jgi:MYXO-CTERM domain-containing protein
MTRIGLSALSFLLTVAVAPAALGVRSAELYSSASYGYGRMEARVRFAAGDGVISSFFSWKEGSEVAGTFWNELDFEKLGADCHLETNPLYGNPAVVHSEKHTLSSDLCGDFHVYAYEWTPEAIAWLVDGVEIRRETGATATAFAENASAGMQVHFNVWPGDATFGGNFDPAILPVHQYIDWVAFSSYSGGTFTEEWREDFEGGTVPAGWLTGTWASPKNLSTHDPGNVNFLEGYAVLSLTADNAVGPAGAMPTGAGGTSGAGGAGGTAATGGSTAAGGTAGGAVGAGGSAGSSSGAPSSGGSSSAGGPSGGAGAGTAGSVGGAGATTGAGGAGAGAGASSTGSSCSLASPTVGHRGAWLAALVVAALAALRRRASSDSALRS